jgi:hypothetical protein
MMAGAGVETSSEPPFVTLVVGKDKPRGKHAKVSRKRRRDRKGPREVSPADKCRRNGWRKGTRLRGTYHESRCDPRARFFKITAIGTEKVLAKEYKPFLFPGEKVTFGEELLPMFDPDFIRWRKAR